jgi:hypothetical protein
MRIFAEMHLYSLPLAMHWRSWSSAGTAAAAATAITVAMIAVSFMV